MNITLRKLAMLEKSLMEQEENVKLQGYTSNPVNSDVKQRITKLMDKVRAI